MWLSKISHLLAGDELDSLPCTPSPNIWKASPLTTVELDVITLPLPPLAWPCSFHTYVGRPPPRFNITYLANGDTHVVGKCTNLEGHPAVRTRVNVIQTLSKLNTSSMRNSTWHIFYKIRAVRDLLTFVWNYLALATMFPGYYQKQDTTSPYNTLRWLLYPSVGSESLGRS